MNARTLIVGFAIIFFGGTIIGGSYSYERAMPRSYGYIWNLPPDLLTPRVLDQTYGKVRMPPDWMPAYGPVPVKSGNEWHEEWRIIMVQV